tara:strand:+ start:148 stop:5097 length:4950 start_codon:yes stop_codon:yes gene_type:complete
MPKQTVCGVRLATWGTQDGAGNGVMHHIDTKLFGGNPGHASLSVTFPANNETKEWIRQYCLDPPIPFEKHKVETKKAILDASGNYVQTDETVFEEEVYVVNFSWFPGLGGFTLSSSINGDGLSEQGGVHCEWDPKYRDFIQPEQRYHRGALGSQLMTYGASRMTHERNLSIAQKRNLNLRNEYALLDKEKKSLDVIANKLQNRNEFTTPISPTEMLILDSLVPKWREDLPYENKQILSETLRDSLLSMVKNKQHEKSQAFNEVTDYLKDSEVEITEGVLGEIKKIKVELDLKARELDQIKEQLESHPLSDTLHIKKTITERDIQNLEAKQDKLKETDEYKYNAIQNGDIRDWQDVINHLDEMLDSTNEKFSADNNVADITYTFNADLNMAFGHLINEKLRKAAKAEAIIETGWKDNHIKPKKGKYNQISEEEAIALRAFAQAQIKLAKEKSLELDPGLTTFEQSDFEHFTTVGKPPDNYIHMRINQEGGFTQGLEQGMNVEAMLQEMQKIITDDNDFSMATNNCSITVGRVLEAGTTGPHLKSKFKNKALGAIGNPQIVYNNAKHYNEAINSPNDNVLKKISRFNPITVAGGWCIKTLLFDDKASPAKKIGAGFAAVPISLAAGLIAGGKKLANPLKSFNELTSFVKYAHSRPSTGFKIGATILAAPAIAVMAIPAGIQFTGKKLISGIGKAASSIRKRFSSSKQSSLIEDNVDIQDKDISKGLSIEAKIKSELEAHTTYVNSHNPTDALNQFQTALKATAGPVAFDKKTEKLVNKRINKIKNKETQERVRQRYQAMCLESIGRVESIQKTFLAEIGTSQQKATSHPLTTDNNDEVIKIKEAEYEEKEQFYSVMPILGEELAHQMKGYYFYQETNSKQSERHKDLGIPPTVDANNFIHNDGYLVNQVERDYISKLFSNDPNLQEIAQGTAFPDDHPLAGEQLSCAAFKDNHGNVYVMNQAVLGQGSFGTVKIIQAIETPGADNPVHEKEFYAVKIQDVTESNSLASIKAEMNINERFGLHFGGLTIKHEVMVAPPEYAFASDKTQTFPEEHNPTSISTSDEDALLDSSIALEAGTFNAKETGTFNTKETGTFNPKETGTFNAKETGTFNPKETGTFNPKETGTFNPKETGTFNPKETGTFNPTSAGQENEKTPLNFFANYVPPPDIILDSKDQTLAEVAANQPDAKQVTHQGDISQFDVLNYLDMFEKMTAEVEKVHNKGVLHRDIKAENFLYNADTGEMKLIDFGISRLMNDPKLSTPFDMCEGSPTNMAPELFHDDYTEKISSKQDIYGLARTFGLLMIRDLRKYHADAYKEDIPSPNVPRELVDKMQNMYLQNFRLDNEPKNPHIDAINQMIELINDMKNLDVEKRPEAAIVKKQLHDIIVNYKAAVQLEQTVPTAQPEQTVATTSIQDPKPQHKSTQQNMIANLQKLDGLEKQYIDKTNPEATKKIIHYITQALKETPNIEATITRLKDEMKKTDLVVTDPSNNQTFSEALEDIFIEMRKPRTSSAKPSHLGLTTPSSSSVLFGFKNHKLQSQPTTLSAGQSELSQNVMNNLDLLQTLLNDYQHPEDASTHNPSEKIIAYIEQNLDTPHTEAAMARLINEMEKSPMEPINKNNSVTFQQALKEVFEEMKKSEPEQESKSSIKIGR